MWSALTGGNGTASRITLEDDRESPALISIRLLKRPSCDDEHGLSKLERHAIERGLLEGVLSDACYARRDTHLSKDAPPVLVLPCVLCQVERRTVEEAEARSAVHGLAAPRDGEDEKKES